MADAQTLTKDREHDDAIGQREHRVALRARRQCPVGLVALFIAAVALLCALDRLHRAMWVNHRYLFTSWRCGRIVAALLVIGTVMKLMLPT